MKYIFYLSITLYLVCTCVYSQSPCNSLEIECDECCVNGKCYTGAVCDTSALVINNGLSDIIYHWTKIMMVAGLITMFILCCCCFWTHKLIKRFKENKLRDLDNESQYSDLLGEKEKDFNNESFKINSFGRQDSDTTNAYTSITTNNSLFKKNKESNLMSKLMKASKSMKEFEEEEYAPSQTSQKNTIKEKDL